MMYLVKGKNGKNYIADVYPYCSAVKYPGS